MKPIVKPNITQNITQIPNSIDQLYEWTKFRILSGREQKMLRFKTLLDRLEISVPPSHVVKVAGTNGKGSVAAMLEAIFLADQKKVVLFTSPHLSRVTERFRVDGVEILPDILDDAVRRIAPKLVSLVTEEGQHLLPSFFEALTLIAIEHFQFYQADMIILEAGIGGYNDIVHLVPAEVSIITTIGLDHTDQLGTTLAEIATDKAGIASPDSTLVLGSKITKSALDAIVDNSKYRGIEIICAKSESLQVKSLGFKGHQVTFSLNGKNNTFIMPLVGSFQMDNLATAKAAFDVLLSRQIVHNQKSFFGVSQVRWPGRMELIEGNPNWLIDAAHNIEAIAQVTGEFSQLAKENKVAILLGLSDHNNIADLAPYLTHLAETIGCPIYLTSGFYRSIDPLTYMSIFTKISANVTNLGDYQSAIDYLSISEQFSENIFILITGSIFLIGACREYILSSK